MKITSFLLAIAVATVASCSAVKKSQHKATFESSTQEKKGIDTTATTKSSSAKTTTQAGGSVAESTYVATRELTVEFVEPSQPTAPSPINSGVTAQDYLDTTIGGTRVRSNGPKSSITVLPGGGITIHGQAKSLKFKETGTGKLKDSSFNTQQIQENTASEIKKQGIDTTASINDTKVTQSDTEKRKIGSPAGVWIPVALGGLVILILAWRFGFLRRKKQDPDDKNSNPLVKGSYTPPAPPSPKV